ncbi:ADP-ribosylation factor-like protein 9 [Erinaceus europaeus]|uniref:ADP-ribosylation factor-like protein 9 n=1 Tax=Erinaceus europaeus TaxID=9365 RepID=A0ABM3X5B8_ERIEU|nr:ADP-ribosylation factor-like protein 9 [Erinaceus europaeus]
MPRGGGRALWLAAAGVTAGVACAAWIYVCAPSPPPAPHLRGPRAGDPARGRAWEGGHTEVVEMERGKLKKKEKGKEQEKEKTRERGKEEKKREVEKEIKEKERGNEKEEKLKKKDNRVEEKKKERETEEKNKRKEDREEKRKEREEEEQYKRKDREEEKKERDTEKEKSRRKEDREEEKKERDTEKEEKHKRKDREEEKKDRETAKEEKYKLKEKEKRKERETEKEQERNRGKEENDSSTLEKPLLEPPSKNKQILVLGLDGAGKTSVLHSLALNRVQHSKAPTKGFNVVCISTEDRQMEFLEIGGSEPFRPYWSTYLSQGLVLIFVVDSADHNRLPEAKKYLHQLIRINPILPLVVFANKQDLETAYHITDIHEALALSEVGNDRKLFLFGTQVTENGSEIPSSMQDAKGLIAQLAADMQ